MPSQIAPVPSREVVEATKRKAMSAGRRLRILRQWKSHCVGCNKNLLGVAFEVDHFIPVELGGDDEDYNMRPLCIPCHKRKTKADIKAISKARRIRRKLEKPLEPGSIASRPFQRSSRKLQSRNSFK